MAPLNAFSRRWGRVCAPALLLILLAACGTPAPQPLIFGDAPWSGGEASVYRVTDVNGSYAGSARYDMTRQDETTWNMRRETSTQGTQEIVVLDMSVGEYRPSLATMVRIDDGGTEQVRTTYSGSEANLELTSKQNITTYQRVSIPSDARDQRSLVVLVRTLPLADNYATRINSFLPIVPILDRVTLSVRGREEVQVPAGTFDTWKVRLDTGDSETLLWVGVDVPHPVVKYVDGRNRGTYELIEFQPGS
jgi:hypothetical protein